MISIADFLRFKFDKYKIKESVGMDFVKGTRNNTRQEIGEVLNNNLNNNNISVHGTIHIIRDMGDFDFIVLRKKDGLVQCVYDKKNTNIDMSEISEGCCVVAEGKVVEEKRSPNGFEIELESLKILSKPFEPMPININKRKMNTSLETKLSLRPITLRNIRERAVFKLQEGVVRGFREALQADGFTEIRTPKITKAGAEGGSNIFKLDYFGKKAFLAQSPQFYKQTLVGVFEKVFEVAPVFRAEKHNTTRHLNEYVSMDFEMGFIDGFEDIMETETMVLKNIMKVLKKDYSKEIEILGVELPEITEIPAVRFKEAKELVAAEYGRKIKDPYDLEPEEEQLIGKYFKEKYDSDFVFVTHYPSKKRPFYAMDDPQDTKYTLSFDLLFKGLEVTTGGQRIHDYQQQVDKMIKKGLNPADFESYLMIHKYGMPPHGGLGIGLERLCMQLLGENNVRETSMFPRDMNRLEP